MKDFISNTDHFIGQTSNNCVSFIIDISRNFIKRLKVNSRSENVRVHLTCDQILSVFTQQEWKLLWFYESLYLSVSPSGVDRGAFLHHHGGVGHTPHDFGGCAVLKQLLQSKHAQKEKVSAESVQHTQIHLHDWISE